MPHGGRHARYIVEILGGENPPAQPAFRLRCALQVEVGKSMFFGA